MHLLAKTKAALDDDKLAVASSPPASQDSVSNAATMTSSMASVGLAAAAASRHWYSNKAEMLPFLSLCSRYPGGPWAGLLQQTMKDKQKGKYACFVYNILYKLIVKNLHQIAHTLSMAICKYFQIP